MRSKLINIFIMFLCICIGGLITYLFIYKRSYEMMNLKINKNVTITDTGIADAVDKVKDSVVVVENYKQNELSGTGTGFVYKIEDDDAYIMTNQHVIENATEIKIIFSNNKVVVASLIGSDPYADIAILKVGVDNILKVANIGNSNDLRVGDTVFAIGTPIGSNYAGTATKGILSGKNRLVSVSVNGKKNEWIMNVMQTDTAINPGNSGGPLCNANGEVIGISSLKIVESKYEGMGFAIPIEDALDYAEYLIKNGSIPRPNIGIEMLEVTNYFQLTSEGIKLDSSIKEGVVIKLVENNSSASDAKLQVGDVIIKVGEDNVSNIAEFRYRLFKYKTGDKVSLTIIRDGEQKTVKVKIKKSE